MSDSLGKNFYKSLPDGSERRYLPRWIVTNRILYRKEDQPHFQECSSKDLSGDGACLSCPETLPFSGKLTLVVYLSEEIAVQVKASVLWNKPSFDPKNQNLYGVRFEELSNKVQEMILQYAFECKKDVLTKHWFEGWE